MKHATEQLKIVALPRLKWMLDEEWDDRAQQVAASAHAEGCSIGMIAPDDSATEEFSQRVQQLDVAFVLHDGELGQHLAVRAHTGMIGYPDMKTSFTVHESCDPFRLEL